MGSEMKIKINKAVPLTDADLLGEATQSITEMVMEARKKALKENILANTVLIDKHFAKVNKLDFVFLNTVTSLPPMICGLEVHVTDELPEGYSFALAEALQTERKRLIRATSERVAREIFEEIENTVPKKIVINGELVYDCSIVLDEIKKKYIGEGATNER